ncbi:MAG: hypothetical protein RLY93_00655 [Sumerlaeia bacterium]
MTPQQGAPPSSPDPTRQAAERQAAIFVILAIVAGAIFFFVVMDFDVEAHRTGRKLARVEEDLMVAQNTLMAMALREGSMPEPEVGAAPPLALSGFYAQARGGQPYWQEKGRLARLDVFSPGKPYRDPFFYGLWNGRWILASQGPDGDRDVTTETLTRLAEEGEELPLGLRYNPTNGALSSGDIWVAGEAP